mmetsp:Transcript_128383/g.371580  ORF Transcript_128383/g.371580 Transcript_128383/m.371580 type:complete len:173 (-) Transcript_128383:82-600(-)
MAKTAKGMVDDDKLYEKILYVSKDRLESLTKKLAGGKAKDKDVTAKDVEELMYPEDLDDDKLLVPVDVSKSGDDFPSTHEELVEKFGPKKAVEAIIAAAAQFEAGKSRFKKNQLPVPMTVGEWIVHMGMTSLVEELGEEEDLEGDEEEELDDEEEGAAEEAEAPAKKKRKVA